MKKSTKEKNVEKGKRNRVPSSLAHWALLLPCQNLPLLHGNAECSKTPMNFESCQCLKSCSPPTLYPVSLPHQG